MPGMSGLYRPARTPAVPGREAEEATGGYSVRFAGSVRRRARLLGQRGDLERAARGVLEDVDRLLLGARVELDEEGHDDQLVVMLVEADVREELASAGLAERAEGQAVGGVRAGAGLDLV